MGKGKASGVPKGPTLTQLFRQLPVEGSGSHVLFADPAPDSLAWNEELDRCEDDDGSRMFESMDDSAMIEACVRCEGLQSDKTADPLDRKLSPADAMESHILEGSLLPPSQDSRDSMATAASTSSVPAAAASLPSSVASPPSIGGSPHSCGTVRLRPNPYLLNRSKMKRANSMPITHETDNENPEAKKPKTEALAVAAASDGTASGHVPGSSSAHEQNGSTESLIQSDRRGVGQPAVLDPRLASSGSSAAGAAPAAPIIVASSRSRCRVIGASPQKNLANLFEKSATELLSQTSVASQSRQSTVDQKFDICYKPRHETMRAREYRVGDTYICSIPRKNTAKHAKGRTACDKRVVTILGFIKGKSRAVVEVRLELQDTFLNSNFDPAANQTWMNRYGSAYLTEGKTLCLLLNRFKEKVESVPISSIQYSGIDQGDNRNFVYQYRSAQCTAVRERLLPRKPVALELFAGAGGMSLGMKDAGFDVKYLVEMNFHVAHTLERNFDRLHLSYEMYNEDVLDFLDNIRNNAPRYPRVGDVDHIHASSPCQGFSRANRNGGQNDTPNNDLSKTFVAAIKLLRPRTASFENVRGMLDKHVSYVHEILRDLLLEGYQVRLCLLKSSDYSVPQTRRRLFILASQQGCLLPSKPASTSKVTVTDAINDLEHVRPMPGSGTVRLPNGKWISHHNSEGTEVKSDPQSLSQFNHGYVSAVMTSKPIKHYSSKLNRLLTPRERARLQTFPDDYEFSGSVREVKAQIGNAVPCNLARCVGYALMECHTNEPVLSDSI